MPQTTAFPDQSALAEQGARVRARLATTPGAMRLPVDQAELYALPDFLSAEECARFIALIDTVAQPSASYDAVRDPSVRTSCSSNLDRHAPFVQAMERRIDALMGIDHACGETVQGQRYQPGQEFKAHNDWFRSDADYWPAQQAEGGQRSWTVMIYLNDVEEGGATTFEHLGVAITPQAGALVTWNNATPEGIPNDWCVHAATPVARGVKYVITKWYRTRTWG